MAEVSPKVFFVHGSETSHNLVIGEKIAYEGIWDGYYRSIRVVKSQVEVFCSKRNRDILVSKQTVLYSIDPKKDLKADIHQPRWINKIQGE